MKVALRKLPLKLWLSALLPRDPQDVFLYDRLTAQLDALPELNGQPGTPQGHPTISSDGRFIAFESERGGRATVLLYDRLTGLSVPLPGLDDPGAEEGLPSIS